MKRNGTASVVALVLALFVVSGCGTGFTVGQGVVTVDGLAAGQLVLCGANNEILQITGSGFLSEHGNEVIVEFTALQGAPFNGEPSEQVQGIALSDSLVEAFLPSVAGATELTVTIILPGSNFGVSPPETIQLGGQLVGPFALDDDMNSNTTITTVTGNVTYNAPVPGVLLNDMPAFCGETETEIPEKPRPAPGSASHAILFQGLSVIAPPPGSVNPFDASPGLTTPTMNGGTVVIQADGSFVYEPPLGYEGNDSFTYWMEQPGRPADWATATLTVDKVVWFIRDTAVNESVAFVGTGRFSDPFDSLHSFNNAQNAPATDPFSFPPTQTIPPNPDDAPQEGDCIFIYENVLSDQYDGGIRLRDRQRLIGEGTGLFVNGMQIVPAAFDGNPTLTNTIPAFGEGGSLPVVTLANENFVCGIDIDQPLTSEGMSSEYGDGIFGFDVSGPTFIDNVNIRNAGRHGIHLFGFGQSIDLQALAQPILGGTYHIGDPLAPGVRVTITDSGQHGIKINDGFSQSISIPTAAVNGLTVNVASTEIIGSGLNGIEANDCNLDVRASTIEDCDTGINYTNNLFGQLCTLFVENSNIGLQILRQNTVFRGIQINPFGNVQADIGFTSGLSEDTFLVGGNFSTGGFFHVAIHDNDFQSQTTSVDIPTVDLFGSSTTVTSLDSNYIVGNGQSEGMFFDSVTFDADPNAVGTQPVPGGATRLGQGAATLQRIEGTSLRFFGCSGELTFTTLDIWQLGGDPTGILNTGTLTINEGTKTIDVQP